MTTAEARQPGDGWLRPGHDRWVVSGAAARGRNQRMQLDLDTFRRPLTSSYSTTDGPWADRIPTRRARGMGLRRVAAAGEARDLATTAADRARFAGTCRLALPDGQTLDRGVVERGGKVMTQAEGQPEIQIRHQGNGVFGADFDPSLRLTFAPGTPTPKITLVQGGATIEGLRVQ